MIRKQISEEASRLRRAIVDEAGTMTPVRGYSPPSMYTVPNKPKTPHRTFRAPDEIWALAQLKAKARNETVTDVLIRALREYVESDDGEVS